MQQLPDLTSNPLFSGMGAEDVSALLKPAKIRNLAKGAQLFHHGDKVTHFYIIISGVLKLYRLTPQGDEKTLDILNSGQILCENEIMDSCHCHRMSAEAVEDSVVLELPVSWLKETVKSSPAFALNLLSLIAGRMNEAEIEAEHQATMSAPQLVACFLQRICVLHDYNPKSFELPYSKSLIASRLGIEAETFSRTLAKLKDHGIVVKGNHVSINDLEKIESYLCDFCSIADECTTHKSISKKLDNI